MKTGSLCQGLLGSFLLVHVHLIADLTCAKVRCYVPGQFYHVCSVKAACEFRMCGIPQCSPVFDMPAYATGLQTVACPQALLSMEGSLRNPNWFRRKLKGFKGKARHRAFEGMLQPKSKQFQGPEVSVPLARSY